jgi:hypothetical protein
MDKRYDSSNHKKCNVDDVNNYRGITLTSVFSKIFSSMLDTRLRKWAETNNLLSGFVTAKAP